MPNRILRESILTSRAVNQLSAEAEIFYRRLMSVVDDYGRFEADPDILIARLYPLQLSRTSADICGQMLAECGQVLTTDREPLVLVYCVGNKTYLQINNFQQRTRSKSKFPDPLADICGQMTADDSNCRPIARATNTHTHTTTDTTPTTREGSQTDGLVEWLEALPYPKPIGNRDARAIVTVLVSEAKVALFKLHVPLWLEYFESVRWSYGLEKFLFGGYWEKRPPKTTNPDEEEF